MPELRNLRSLVRLSNTDDGDAISAIVIAIQMIDNQCKKLQYIKKIILVTNGRSVMDDEDVPQIVSKLREDNIELVIMYVFLFYMSGLQHIRPPSLHTARAVILAAAQQ
ncbi:ATP-dependent DNA helicase yku80 [Cryomyces antarcticus]|uniref:ATP-dependent DNA helicase yku80 n=1 Tax=Cryomyces antarcticus TaxID=329879 RepID=A0ABR0LT89_9PEZI|nr:ATP-dependent DNA helicase yku80 [Cryomyces antarcticus]